MKRSRVWGLATSRIIALFFVLFAFLYPIPYTLYSAQASADIGESHINPASPFYFLKSVREILELKFAGTTRIRAYRQLEFATRRLREVNSLVKTSRQDLITPTLERYVWHMGQLKGKVSLKDIDMVEKISNTISAQMDSLLAVYQQVTNIEAKRSIRSTINRLSQWDQWLIEELISVNQTSFTQQIATSKLLGCNFLSKEASESALNEVEKNVYVERASKCIDSSNSLFLN